MAPAGCGSHVKLPLATAVALNSFPCPAFNGVVTGVHGSAAEIVRVRLAAARERRVPYMSPSGSSSSASSTHSFTFACSHCGVPCLQSIQQYVTEFMVRQQTLAFSFSTRFMMVPVRGGGCPRGMLLATRMAGVQLQQHQP
jgi:hypothetical protein